MISSIISAIIIFFLIISIIGSIYWRKRRNKKKETYFIGVSIFLIILNLIVMVFSDKISVNNFASTIKNLDSNRTKIKVVIVDEDKFVFDSNSFETDSKKVRSINSIADKKVIFSALSSVRMMPKHYKSTRNSYVYIIYLTNKEKNIAIYLTQGSYLKYDFLVYVRYVNASTKKYFSKHIGGFNSRGLKKLFDMLKFEVTTYNHKQ